MTEASDQPRPGIVRRFLELPFHPLLFTGYAVLFLWAQNVLKVRTSDVLATAAEVLAGTLVVAGVFAAIFRNVRRGAIIATVFAFLFFSFGHLVRPAKVAPGEVANSAPHQGAWLIVWAVIAIVAIVGVARLKPDGRRFAFVVNVVLAVLCVMSMYTIVSEKLEGRREAAAVATATKAADANAAADPPSADPASTQASGGAKRDIYYVVFEDTPGQAGLKRFYNYDASGFVKEMESRGFYVPSHPTAPYPKTVHMLSSTLNMNYLSNDTFPKKSHDWRLAYNSVKNPKIAQLLRDRGYKYDVFGSGYFVVRRDESAAVNPIYSPAAGPVQSEFSQVLYDSTVLSAIASRYHVGTLDERYRRYQEVLFWQQKLPTVAHDPAPTFTFAHLETTHNPYVFDRNGRFISLDRAKKMSTPELYLESVRYAHKQIVQLVDKLQAAYPKDQQPIIIVQTDEGPGPVGWNPNTKAHYDWTTAPQNSLDEKFSTFSAYSFPGVTNTGLYPTMSPVNTFRLLMNNYFGGKYPLLPDRSYIYPDELHPYQFIDVTDRIKP